MNSLKLVNEIVGLQQESIIIWKEQGVQLSQQDLLKLVEENHAFNYQLWHAEDRARRDDLGHEMVYLAKREIDHCNQQRNNRMEAIDEWCAQQFKPVPHTDCPVHSETPGMIIDRLSIMALKAYHMKKQTLREDVDKRHTQQCLDKWQVIQAQRKQLMDCLIVLLNEIQAGSRTFRVYHQFKMYNDPALNPELYQNQ